MGAAAEIRSNSLEAARWRPLSPVLFMLLTLTTLGAYWSVLQTRALAVTRDITEEECVNKENQNLLGRPQNKKNMSVTYRNVSFASSPSSSLNPYIYALHDTGKGSFYLFVKGFRRNDQFSRCVVGNATVELLLNLDGVIECRTPALIKDGDLLTVEWMNGETVSSTVRWKMRKAYLKEKRNVSLCIVTMVKDEEDSLNDWLQYHTYEGAGLFLIYDNNSTDGTARLLDAHPLVRRVPWPWHKTQEHAFVHGLLQTRHVCAWSLFIDVDEYVFPSGIVDRSKTKTGTRSSNETETEIGSTDWNSRFTRNGNVVAILLDVRHWVAPNTPFVDHIDQVCLASKDMGSSGRRRRPASAEVPELYVHRAGWAASSFGKCAVRPLHAVPWTRVHAFRVFGVTTTLPRDVMHVVHYKYQCWDCYLAKLTKGRASAQVKDWSPERVNAERRRPVWAGPQGPRDVAFRDYKRSRSSSLSRTGP